MKGSERKTGPPTYGYMKLMIDLLGYLLQNSKVINTHLPNVKTLQIENFDNHTILNLKILTFFKTKYSKSLNYRQKE